MTILTPIALYTWPLIVLLLFGVLPPRRAMLAGLIGGWLFLPMAGYHWMGAMDWTKPNVTGVALLLGVAVMDHRALLRFRLRWFDMPVLIFILWPGVSAVANGLTTLGDIGTPAIQNVLAYGVPYVLGRVYFRTPADLRELALAVFIGGLVYAPLCLYEIRMSPQLHATLYGFHQHSFVQAKRFGGWRPLVFMQHGLAVGMWMTAASIAGLALWKSGAVRRFWGLPVGWYVAALLLTTVLCKSMGALLLLAIAAALLLGRRFVSLRGGLAVLIAVVPAYMVVRSTDWLTVDAVCSTAAPFAPEDRLASMRGRLMQEDLLAERAMERPVFGWGPWGGFRVEDGHDLVAASDGMWIIMFGKYGLIGLASFTLIWLLPPALLIQRQRASAWRGRETLLPVALGLIVLLFMHDNLMNAMANPIFVLVAGALGGTGFACATKAVQGPHAMKCGPRDAAIGDLATPRNCGGRQQGSEPA